MYLILVSATFTTQKIIKQKIKIESEDVHVLGDFRIFEWVDKNRFDI